MGKRTQFAVAVRDGNDLFLWLQIRRSPAGDVYVAIPTGRNQLEWKKWNPHASHHKDGHFHHKSFDREQVSQVRQKPDCGFHGTENLITRPIAADEPRAFREIVKLAEFAELMEIPVDLVSTKKYETCISVDLSEPDGLPIITPGARILAQHAFQDAVPWILVTLFSTSTQ